MSRHLTSEAESSKRRDAAAPYTLPSRPLTQSPTVPRQSSALPQSPASLQQYAAASSQYPAGYGQYTTTRQQYVPQASSSKHEPPPPPPSAPASSATPRARRYSRKRLLTVYFKDNDFNEQALNGELHAVANLFVNDLGFTSRSLCAIEDSDETPTDQLIEALTKFTKACKDNNELLVVYYSGHGGARKPRGLMLADYENDAELTVYWNRVQKEVLFKANADVLVLLDCCHAELGIKGLHHYRRDTIAACAANETTRSPGPRSFTTCLIAAANQLLAASSGFTPKHLCDQTEAVASQKWYDGAARAEKPVYKGRCGDQANHEIYLELVRIPPSATASAQSSKAPQCSAPSRQRTSSRRDVAQTGAAEDDEDESTSNEEESDDNNDDEDDEDERPTNRRAALSTSTAASQTDLEQRRVYVRAAWSRMSQGYTPAQALRSLVQVWQTCYNMSAQEAERQIREFLR